MTDSPELSNLRAVEQRAGSSPGRAGPRPPGGPRGGAATFRATSTTNAGSLRLPRWGGGARNGASVSTSRRSAGTVRATSWMTSGAREGHDARERDVEPEGERPPGQLVAAGEAVDDPAGLPGAFLFQDGRPSPSSASRVWTITGRPTSRARRSCRRKTSRCDVARRVVVVEVEADLADGHDAPVPGQPAQLVVDRLGRQPRLVGVDAGRARASRARPPPAAPAGGPLLVHAADEQHGRRRRPRAPAPRPPRGRRRTAACRCGSESQ